MTQRGPATEFNLPATLDQNAAQALADNLGGLPRSSEIRLNAAAVSVVSPGYLQVLVSAFKTFPNIGVANPSDAFAASFAEYGIDYPPAQPTAAPQAKTSNTELTPVPENLQTPPVQAVEMPDPDVSAVEPTPATEGPRSRAIAELPAAQPTAPEAEILPLAAAGEAQTADAAAAKKILTIDDSRTMRDMLRMTLAGAGFTVIQAVDGEDGLNALAQQPVDLIITDINMPKLDGFGVIRAVRSDHAHDDTPILVLSTESEQESKDIAKNAGATGWIVKPFDPEGLVKLVNTVCG